MVTAVSNVRSGFETHLADEHVSASTRAHELEIEAGQRHEGVVRKFEGPLRIEGGILLNNTGVTVNIDHLKSLPNLFMK